MIARAAAAIGLAIVLSAPPAQAQTSASPRPALQPAKPYQSPQVTRFTLANGLQVALVPGGQTPTTSLSLRFPAGNHDEGDQPWIADITSSLLLEGAGGLAADEVSARAADMGGRLQARTSVVETNLNVTVLSESALEALALISQVAREPRFEPEAFARVQQNFRRNLDVQRTQPAFQAEAALVGAHYGLDHAYGRVFPAPAQLDGYTVDTVKAFHASHYGPRTARLYIAGRFDAAEMRRAIERTFGDWSGDAAPERAPAKASDRFRAVLVDRPGASQATVRLLYPAPSASDPADIAMRAANALLAGSASSRMMRNIRGDKGYAYSLRSHLAYRDGAESNWVFAADVDASKTGPALVEIIAEVERLRTTAPTQEETAQLQTLLNGQFVVQNTTVSGTVDTLAEADRLGLPADWIDQYSARIGSLDAEGVRDVAARHLDQARATLVVVGDLASVRPQLEAVPALQGVVFEIFEP